MSTTTPPKRPGTRSAAIAAAFATIRQLSSQTRVWNSNLLLRPGEDYGASYAIGDCRPEGSGLNIQRNRWNGESKLTAMRCWHYGCLISTGHSSSAFFSCEPLSASITSYDWRLTFWIRTLGRNLNSLSPALLSLMIGGSMYLVGYLGACLTSSKVYFLRMKSWAKNNIRMRLWIFLL